MPCKIDLSVECRADQDGDQEGGEDTEVGEAIKAAAAAEAAIATFASVSAETATGVPQVTSHWWHPSVFLQRGQV